MIEAQIVNKYVYKMKPGDVLGGAAPVSVRVTLVDGSTQDVPIGCGGLAMGPACSDDPHLEPASIILGGYHDVPCAGEPPAGCATGYCPAATPSLKPNGAKKWSIMFLFLTFYRWFRRINSNRNARTGSGRTLLTPTGEPGGGGDPPVPAAATTVPVPASQT